jgi:DNA-binding MarR family transcriptional regulator
MKHSSASLSGSFAAHAVEIRDRLHHLIGDLDDTAETLPPVGDPATADRVRRILKARRARDGLFDGDLFADPAWDILLELYEAELSNRRLSISSLCIGAAVPPTTALRWIKSLEQRGLLVRRDDLHDRRRVFAHLSDAGLKRMDELFRILPAGEQLI